MLFLIFKVIVIVLCTSKIVDVVEEKGQRSLWVKIGTPVMWIVGEGFGAVAAVIMTGMTPEQAADPMYPMSAEGANAFFLMAVLRVVGAFIAVGAVYLYARSLKTVAIDTDTSFR